jgi:hypothetical protein
MVDPFDSGSFRLPAGIGRPQESEFERRKQKALDDLRAMVSPKVWEHLQDYVRSMLETATPQSLTGVVEDLKVQAKLAQDEEDARTHEQEAHQSHMQDTLVLSSEATERLHGQDPLHGYEAGPT